MIYIHVNPTTCRLRRSNLILSNLVWESRFKSQALLDERALLTCMAYVDLNPIRAAMAKTPEESDYTSIQERLTKKSSYLLNLGFNDSDIDFTLADYIDLVDSTGRLIVAGKKGFIDENMPPILERLGVEGITWINELNQFKSKGKLAIMIYVHINPTLCRLRRSNLIQSNLVVLLKNLNYISKTSKLKSS